MPSPPPLWGAAVGVDPVGGGGRRRRRPPTVLWGGPLPLPRPPGGSPFPVAVGVGGGGRRVPMWNRRCLNARGAAARRDARRGGRNRRRPSVVGLRLCGPCGGGPERAEPTSIRPSAPSIEAKSRRVTPGPGVPLLVSAHILLHHRAVPPPRCWAPTYVPVGTCPCLCGTVARQLSACPLWRALCPQHPLWGLPGETQSWALCPVPDK